MHTQIHHLLKSKQLSITVSREATLSVFLKEKIPLSFNDIDHKLCREINRVTLYRILGTFVRTGILKTIPTLDNSVLYILPTTENKNKKRFAYFICSECKQKQDIDLANTQDFSFLSEEEIHCINILLEGLCKSCKH